MHFWWGSDLSGEKMTKHGQKELKGRGCVLFFTNYKHNRGTSTFTPNAQRNITDNLLRQVKKINKNKDVW